MNTNTGREGAQGREARGALNRSKLLKDFFPCGAVRQGDRWWAGPTGRRGVDVRGDQSNVAKA